MASRTTLAQLAAEADMDLDEALVTLWDVGLDSLLRPTDVIAPTHLNRARTALGLASNRAINTVNYWLNRLDIDLGELERLLSENRLRLASGARTLPKGGVAAMRRYERQGHRLVARPPAEAQPSGKAERAATPAPPQLVWRDIGRRRELHFLTDTDVLEIHNQLFEDFLHTDDPIDTPGTRSDDLLASACGRPQTGHGDTFKYPTVEMAASALAHSLVNNHAFWNGNKRAALVAYLVFLDQHSLVPTCSEDELFRFMLRVSQHRLVPREWPDRADHEVVAMAEWTKANTRLITKGERVIKWHRLRKRLHDYGCHTEVAKNTGNRIIVTRDIEVPGPFKLGKRKRTLRAQSTYGDEGRDADRNAVRKLRTDLQLDEEHGIDSAAFYDGEPRPVGEFILQYRRTLRRLAKL